MMWAGSTAQKPKAAMGTSKPALGSIGAAALPGRQPMQAATAGPGASTSAAAARRLRVNVGGAGAGGALALRAPGAGPKGSAQKGAAGAGQQVDQSNEVATFMKEIGLPMYTFSLLENGFDDFDTLMSIEESDLKELGMPSYHADRVMKRIRELSRGGEELDGEHPVVAFLEDAGLSQYAAVLVGSGFDDMETLCLVEDSDLKDMGIPRGHTVKLRKRLREYEINMGEQEQIPQFSKQVHLAAHQSMQRLPSTPQTALARPLPQPQASALAVARQMPSESMKSAVEQSWEQVQAHGSYHVGELLFRHTFQISPEVMVLFGPEVRQKYRDWSSDDVPEGEQDLRDSRALKKLFGKFVNAVGCTVAGLHDMGKLVPMLTKLGMRHIHYGPVPEHWQVLGKALDLTLQDILREDYTQDVQSAWNMVYGFMSSIMIEGLRQAQELAAAASSVGSDGRGQFGGLASEGDDGASACSSHLRGLHEVAEEDDEQEGAKALLPQAFRLVEDEP
mmetsp:Transcript_170579/g.547149  ORF Transcript_170579/g.547149 Transcript_170579/m.547149 type:complete len:505 (-) Transcript_170579:491-2005(-)